MLPRDQIQRIEQYCLNQEAIAAVYVFGSAATGKDRGKSDIDLALILRSPIDPMKRVEMETALSNLLHKDVDLVIFDKSSPLLQHQILKYGQLIFEDDPAERVRQEVYARKAYFDTSHLYRKIKKDAAHGGP